MTMPLKFAKPERQKRTKARRLRRKAARRKDCREVVIARAMSRCERCGLLVSDEYPECHPQRAHVHEKVPRSLGGDPTDPDNCLLWCQRCHTGGGFHRVERTA